MFSNLVNTKDETDSKLHMLNVYTGLDKRCLKIGWSNGTASRFPYVFLRDNCKCSDCFDSSSQQSLYHSISENGLDFEVEKASVSEDGKLLECLWPDGHKSEYMLDWLRSRRIREESEVCHQNLHDLVKDELVLWDRAMMQDKIPSFDYDAVQNDDQSLFDFMYSLYQNGFVLLDQAPASDGVLLKLSNRIGYVRTTHYGDIFDVKDNQDPSNLAYTRNKLHFHVDLPSMSEPPHIQALHCIRGHATGGRSLFVDGFNVAKQLRKKSFEAFDILTSFCVNYRDKGTDAFGEFFVGFSTPIISLNNSGRIKSFQVNPLIMSDFYGNSSIDEVLAFNEAYDLLTKSLYEPKNVVDIHLKPGQIILFHNTRVLHGRTAFQSSGKSVGRWLQGTYIEWDVIFSKLRVLQKNLGLKTPFLYEQSDHFF